MMRLMRKLTRARPSPRWPLVPRAFPRIEELESRVVPYSVSGNAWPNPQLITLSFVPDGTNLGGVTSNLFATLNAHPGWTTSTWQNQILKGAQLWAQQTNINFSVISDSGADEGSGNYQQGDPTMGDIRIGGYNFGTSGLATANFPPPVNNYSVAGDIQFNTGQTWNIGSAYDLATVAAHEIGHALGLSHSTVSAAEMYATYNATKSSLNSDDTNGIRNIYSSNSARAYDAFNGANNSFSTAASLTALIDGNSTVLQTGLNISTTTQKEYFTIVAPATTTGTMTVTVQSSGLSLLAPTLTVYNASQTQIGSASGAGQYGTTLTVNITGVSAGQQFYVKVAGADSTSFGTGQYAMTFAFAGIAPPAVPLPNTQVLNGSPLQGGGGMALHSGNGSPHATGCNCPFCQGAATSVQQQQILMPPTLKEHDNPVSGVALSSSPQVVGLMDGAASQAVTRVFITTIASRPDSVAMLEASAQAVDVAASAVVHPDQSLPADSCHAAAVTDLAGFVSKTDPGWISWSEACDACFTTEGGTVDEGDDGVSSVSLQGESLATTLDPAAATGMLMLLGGYWRAQAGQPDRPIRRRFAL
jgi:hypothetical protein